MQSNISLVDKVKKKRGILLLTKKLHYSESPKTNKFTSEIIRFKYPFILILQFLDGSVEIL